jgi:hypothetical protein
VSSFPKTLDSGGLNEHGGDGHGGEHLHEGLCHEASHERGSSTAHDLADGHLLRAERRQRGGDVDVVDAGEQEHDQRHRSQNEDEAAVKNRFVVAADELEVDVSQRLDVRPLKRPHGGAFLVACSERAHRAKQRRRGDVRLCEQIRRKIPRPPAFKVALHGRLESDQGIEL